MPNIDVNPGDIILESDFTDILNDLNSERNRRGDRPISINTTDAGGKVEAIDYNTLASGYNLMSGEKPSLYPNLPIEGIGNIIEAWDINRLKNAINAASGVCLCDCDYCTCDCNYCTCDCNYACTCDCNYACTCDCDYCTCDCDYCTCDCDYACTCDCNYSCTCDCDYCTCDCDYCTCDCNYSCTCDCDYSDEKVKENIIYL